MECKTCQILKTDARDKIKVYEDEICVAILTTKPASLGHVIIYPKNHFVIVEQIPDNIFCHLMEIANKISQALFESLGVQGTNILINNGTPAGQDEPHFSIHVLGRKENDGINLEWELKQAPEDQLKSVMNMYKEITDVNVYGMDEGSSQSEGSPNKLNNNPHENKKLETMSDEEDEENYLIKYFEKKPGSN